MVLSEIIKQWDRFNVRHYCKVMAAKHAEAMYRELVNMGQYKRKTK